MQTQMKWLFTSVMYGRGERLKEGRSSVMARGLSKGVVIPVSHICRCVCVCVCVGGGGGGGGGGEEGNGREEGEDGIAVWSG